MLSAERYIFQLRAMQRVIELIQYDREKEVAIAA
jgi:hypothetical protein